MNKRELKITVIVSMILLIVLVSFQLSYAQQTGATANFITNSTKPVASPDSRNDTKGTINTVNLDAEQQNTKWKAYVGNVTSTFVLDDASDYSIYRWTVDSFSGQVYVTRDSSVTWANVNCSIEANKLTEDTNINHDSDAADSVNRTFSRQVHRSFFVGSTNMTENCSYSTVTYQNDADHELNVSAPFQEVILWDGDAMVYTAFVENDISSYRGEAVTTYDFQVIVPDDASGGSPPLTYYFYLELS